MAERLAGQFPGRIEPRLLPALMLAAWYRVLESWTSADAARQDRAALVRHLREAFAAIPAVAALAAADS